MLTDLDCRRAKGRDAPYKLSDAHSLVLYVAPSGCRSWRWKYRIAGKAKLFTFGSYPSVSLARARELRENVARALREGVDPAVERRQRAAAREAAAAATFEALAREWHESQRRLWSKRHAQIVLSGLEKDVFPKLGTLPITAVTAPLVLSVLRPIETRGANETAHRTRRWISEVFARAIGLGLAQADPAAVTRRALGHKVKGHHPAVRTIEAARQVLQAADRQPAHPLTKLASRLLALTAVRSGTLRLAAADEFEDLDGSEPIWRIPGAKLKLSVERKRDEAFEFIVPLSRQAVETVKVAIDFSRPEPASRSSAASVTPNVRSATPR